MILINTIRHLLSSISLLNLSYFPLGCRSIRMFIFGCYHIKCVALCIYWYWCYWNPWIHHYLFNETFLLIFLRGYSRVKMPQNSGDKQTTCSLTKMTWYICSQCCAIVKRAQSSWSRQKSYSLCLKGLKSTNDIWCINLLFQAYW